MGGIDPHQRFTHPQCCGGRGALVVAGTGYSYSLDAFQDDFQDRDIVPTAVREPTAAEAASANAAAYVRMYARMNGLWI